MELGICAIDHDTHLGCDLCLALTNRLCLALLCRLCLTILVLTLTLVLLLLGRILDATR